jgi:23S rRNA U2552 (ribose-2'-O)-methylase RlmE/FtsJ
MKKYRIEILEPKQYLDSHQDIKTIYGNFTSSELFRIFTEKSLLEDKRIGWNYPLDYIYIFKKFVDLYQPGMVVFDIGCGPSPLHIFVEELLGIKIIGIDTRRWSGGDYVDHVGKFVIDPDFTSSIEKIYGKPDLVISISAFEHINLKEHKKCIDYLSDIEAHTLITTCISSSGLRSVTSNQINLGVKDVNSIYNAHLPGNVKEKLADVSNQYIKNELLSTAYNQRFGGDGLINRVNHYLRGLKNYKSFSGIPSRYPSYLSIGLAS